MVSFAGMDPMRFLHSTDKVEVITMLTIAEKVAELRAEANK